MYYFAGESYRDKQRLEREKNLEAQHKRRKAAKERRKANKKLRKENQQSFETWKKYLNSKAKKRIG